MMHMLEAIPWTPRKAYLPSAALHLYGIVLLLFLGACRPEPGASDTLASGTIVASDSLWKKPKEALVAEVDSFVVRHKTPIQVAFPRYSPTDSILVWQPDSANARISVELHTPQGLSWPTYHYVNGALTRVRYRQWRQMPGDTSALEAMVYLEGDSILYCEERTRPLHGLETPGLLRADPYSPSVRTRSEIGARYLQEWPEVRQALRDAGIALWAR